MENMKNTFLMLGKRVTVMPDNLLSLVVLVMQSDKKSSEKMPFLTTIINCFRLLFYCSEFLPKPNAYPLLKITASQ